MCFYSPSSMNKKCPVCGVCNQVLERTCYSCGAELPIGIGGVPAPSAKGATISESKTSVPACGGDGIR